MNKAVFIAGAIGLLFGFLFSGTLGVNFFPEDNPYVDQNMDDEEGDPQTLRKDAEAFEAAYNISDSIYLPITAEQAYQMIEDDETFVLYAGREGCPYCQQYVPVLMEAAENLGLTVIYYIDVRDPLNTDFVSMESVSTTPTTFVFVNGEEVEKVLGYRNLTDTETFISDHIS